MIFDALEELKLSISNQLRSIKYSRSVDVSKIGKEEQIVFLRKHNTKQPFFEFCAYSKDKCWNVLFFYAKFYDKENRCIDKIDLNARIEITL